MLNGKKLWHVFLAATIALGTVAFASSIKVWSTGDSLNSVDLNKNFAHIHNNMVGNHGPRLVNADVSSNANIDWRKINWQGFVLDGGFYTPVSYLAVIHNANEATDGGFQSQTFEVKGFTYTDAGVPGLKYGYSDGFIRDSRIQYRELVNNLDSNNTPVTVYKSLSSFGSSIRDNIMCISFGGRSIPYRSDGSPFLVTLEEETYTLEYYKNWSLLYKYQYPYVGTVDRETGPAPKCIITNVLGYCPTNYSALYCYFYQSGSTSLIDGGAATGASPIVDTNLILRVE